MKKISHLFLAILLSVYVLGCSNKPDDPVIPESKDIPEISNLSRNIDLPKPGEQVTVSATVTAPADVPVTAVKLKWTLNGASPAEVAMSKSGSGNVYSGAIPAQNDGTAVAYTVEATNKNGTAVKNGSYTVTAAPPEVTDDCTHLSLNEINGNGADEEKYIELFNNSPDVAIRLEGVTIYYNNLSSEPTVTWTGTADHILLPKSFLLLQGSKGSGDLSTGLSATQGIIIELVDKEGKRVDFFKIGEDESRRNSYSRIPDGTGKWYLTYQSGTPGVTNGTSHFGADEIPRSPMITGFTRDVSAPTATAAVKVSATVKAFPGTAVSSVVLKWMVEGVAKADITMTKNGDDYSATIPAQAVFSVVAYKVVATNNESETEEVSDSYVVMPEGDIDYTKLKLNEVSGVGGDPEKFYELINTGDEIIPLYNCKIIYNANGDTGGAFPPNGTQGITWTGSPSQVIGAGELFCLIGRGAPGSFTTGLTPERILLITLLDPFGNIIDQCIRALDTGDYAVGRDKSFSRIPDGTGPFYFTAPTPCATNGNDATGLLLVPETQELPADYTKLKLNEVNGVDKWFEIYNTGTEAISLESVKAYYSNSEPANYNLTWTGTSTDNIPAGSYFSTKGITLGTGLSANNVNVRLQLRAPNGTVLDTYEKLLNINTGQGYDDLTNKSHARIPDGTGDWYYTADGVGTSGATNGASTAGLTKIGEENGEIGDVDYAKLKLNEVNGVSGQKWVEIYNTGDDAVPLAGVTINYSNNAGSSFSVQWTFSVSDVIAANGFYSNSSELGSCSANNVNVIITLKSPSGEILDTYTKLLNINTGQGYDYLTNKSHARIPDGTGDWYYTADGTGTRNTTNGVSTAGLTKFGEEIKEVEKIEDADYTGLILNEICGEHKFVEIYNSSAGNISLNGVKLMRNDGASQWIGVETDVIPAGAYRIFLFTGFTTGLDENPAYTGWTVNSGISDQQTLKVALVAPSDTDIDVFMRGVEPWGTGGADRERSYSYSRMSDGTWAYADPTPGAVNGAYQADIVNPGYLTAQPQP